jgi:hypothetical protein
MLQFIVDRIVDVSGEHTTRYLFCLNTLSQHMVEPRSVHWIGAKHVLRYIAGSIDYGLDYIRGDGVSLVWLHKLRLGRKSTSG